MLNKELIFVPRTYAPNSNNKNYMHYTKSGYNYCILINNSSVLPNCVGYAWGRWRELLNAHHLLSKGNAENWWAHRDTYLRGSIPKLGAVACWRKGQAGNGNDGAGHVAIVEDILEDGSIITSNSAYLGSRFYLRTIKPPFNIGSTYVFQGFIYLPKLFISQKAASKLLPIETIAKEVIAGKWGIGADRKARLTNAGYNYTLVQQKVNELVNAKIVIPPKTIDEISKEVIAGLWGQGEERKRRLIAAGYVYKEVQVRVNQILDNQRPKKSLIIIAKEVIAGEWGNGLVRKQNLIKAGYDYRLVQKTVNELLK